MPQKITASDLEFLTGLDEWIAAGKPAYRFAEEQGVSKSLVSYRLRKYGLDDRRAEGLVDARSGESFGSLVRRGQFELPANEREPLLTGAEA